MDSTTMRHHTDSKTLRNEMEKKIAYGHKADDHEEVTSVFPADASSTATQKFLSYIDSELSKESHSAHNILYGRLSLEDARLGDSNSIINQRLLPPVLPLPLCSAAPDKSSLLLLPVPFGISSYSQMP